MSLPKPVMRGLLTTQIGKHLGIAGIVCVVTVAAYKYAIQNPRKQVYAEFYKNYDAHADFERMRNLGLFQSARPDGEEEE